MMIARVPLSALSDLQPVGFQKSATRHDLGSYAARSYSLVRPPGMGWCLICFWERPATGWPGRGGRSWQAALDLARAGFGNLVVLASLRRGKFAGLRWPRVKAPGGATAVFREASCRYLPAAAIGDRRSVRQGCMVARRAREYRGRRAARALLLR